MRLNPRIKKAIEPAAKLNRGVNRLADGAADQLARGTIGAAKSMVKKTDPNALNLWTGYRESKLGAGVAVGAAGAYIGGSFIVQKESIQPKMGAVSYSGAAPIMNADGVAQTTNAATLGSSGNMVFGLHQARKG